ncbi:MAG: MucB/RseB C-terminal domain-containing protein [Candidatus Competibacter sp.]|nr:MucB/RseB C-terminal domain-containing protein [Candidatus Competibacter sp.]
MNPPLFRAALLAALAGLALPVDGASPTAGEAKQWLERMIQATQDLNYEGTFVYVQGADVEAMRIAHSGERGERKKRLVSLTGPPREVIATREGVLCLLPKQSRAFAGDNLQQAHFPISVPTELGRLEGQYEFELLGQDRTAGVDTQVVAIKPRDGWRYGYRLWLDRRNGLLLRSMLLDERSQTIEQLMFTDLQVKPHIDAAVFEPPVATERAGLASAAHLVGGVTNASPDRPVVRSAWKVARAPAGFEKILHNGFPETTDKMLDEHMVLADGLATVSVFVERIGQEGALLEGPSHLGSMNAFGVRSGDYQILVVGEVPADTVRMIATSVTREPEPAQDDGEARKP